jgi:hypothetical protein
MDHLKEQMLDTLSKEERELLVEAEYQGGGAMMVDGGVMERILLEVAAFRLFERELRRVSAS